MCYASRGAMNKKKHIGIYRLASAFIDLSIVLLPAIYLTVIGHVIFFQPLLISRMNISAVWNTPIFPLMLVSVMTIYVFLFKKYIGQSLGKRICGLVIIDNKSGALPKSGQLFIRNFVKGLLFVVIIFISPTIATLTLLLVFKLITFLPVHIVESILSTDTQTETPLIASFAEVTVFLIYFVLYFFLFISFWKDRGIHDILARTNVISYKNVWNFKKLIFLLFIFIVLFWAINPLGIYFENAVGYPLPHPATRILTDNLSTYTNSQNWMIDYNNTQMSAKDSGKITAFFRRDGLQSCLNGFNVYAYYDNPNRLSLDDYFKELENKNQYVFRGSEKEELVINGISSIRVTHKYDQTINSILTKSVYYLVPIDKTIYKIEYDVLDSNSPRGYSFPKAECEQNEKAIDTMIRTFRQV